MLSFVFAFALIAGAGEPPFKPTPEALAQLRTRNEALAITLQRLDGVADRELVDDVAVYHKAVDYILRFPEQFYRESYVADALRLIDHGLQRAGELQRGDSSWPTARGPVCRAYRSSVDGSIQPYALWVPPNYDPARPTRLNVVMHGRNQTLNEVSFLTQGASDRIIAVETGRKSPPDSLTLYVFGRGNNSYRWSGENDVFEAMASVRRRYNVDPGRIVLRGFSMGGTGAWHLGLHFPSRWAAVEAGAGYVQTRPEVLATIHEPHRFSSLAIHDASNCAVNMSNVPFVGYVGALDEQREAHGLIQLVLGREGCEGTQLARTRFLIGPNVGHAFHPDSKRESDAFIDESLPRQQPGNFRFVTYTPSYGTFWDLHVDSLEQLYQRAEVSGSRERIQTSNVWVLKFDTPRTIRIDDQQVHGSVFVRTNGTWKPGEPTGLRKRAGLQGPIDDAFQQPFLCVGPTAGGDPLLAAFRHDFARYFRGDIRIKDPRAVTAEDVAEHNLVLFGDPATNPWIGRVLPGLPLTWTASKIEIAGRVFDSASHTVVMIYPNPLNPGRYVVLNTGHTFACEKVNDFHWYLHPHLGDYAVVEKKTRAVQLAGFFDKTWRISK